ncbi:hypothetical protein [Streptomyces sp. NPDC050485]|uniref:hypothetical protein n=1 Tax=Streptomyces sp. NPDC050485 TaxID=3365617 RepID=UPI0037B926D4
MNLIGHDGAVQDGDQDAADAEAFEAAYRLLFATMRDDVRVIAHLWSQDRMEREHVPHGNAHAHEVATVATKDAQHALSDAARDAERVGTVAAVHEAVEFYGPEIANARTVVEAYADYRYEEARAHALNAAAVVACAPDVVSDPGGVDVWESEGGAVPDDAVMIICHGERGGVFPVAFRGPYPGMVRVSRSVRLEGVRRELERAQDRMVAAQEDYETCEAWRRDANDLHREVRQSAGVLGELVWVGAETSRDWYGRAQSASFAAMQRQQSAKGAVRACERAVAELEAEVVEVAERSAAGRRFLDAAVSGDVPAGRGAWVSVDGGCAVTFPMPWDGSQDAGRMPADLGEAATLWVDALGDAVAARDEGRKLTVRDVAGRAKTGGKGPGSDLRRAIGAAGKPLVTSWKAPKAPAAGREITEATFEEWDRAWVYTNDAGVLAETETAPGVWLPMAAVRLADAAMGNGWTVALQRTADRRRVTVRAAGTATGRVAGELRAVWTDGAYDVTASAGYVGGKRMDTVATLHSMNATVAQTCRAVADLAEDMPPVPDVDVVDVDGWESEGGTWVLDADTEPAPAPVAVQDGTALQGAYIAAHGDDKAMEAARW